MEHFRPMKILCKNGWNYLKPYENISLADEFSQFKASFLGNNEVYTVVAVVSMYKRDLDLDGHFGVLWLEVSNLENTSCFSVSDLEDMKEALSAAEENLLLIGMPFSSNYNFHGSDPEERARINTNLRKYYDLDELERKAKE